MRVNLFLENKEGQICFDQIRCVDKIGLKNKISTLTKIDIDKEKRVLKEYLID